MEPFLDKESAEHVRALLVHVHEPVRVLFFTLKNPTSACRDQKLLLEEFCALSDNLHLEIHVQEKETELAERLGVDKVPATLVQGGGDHGIRFFGLTSGHEFDSLIKAVTLVSSGDPGLDTDAARLISLVNRPVRLEVMVTLTCPYCPEMVQTAHRIALANPNITADMVESSEFPRLVERYGVHGVPRMVINGVPSFEGVYPVMETALEILKIVRPEVYDQIDAKIRETRGERRVRPTKDRHLYDILIVGGGPAALSAAIYASRKGLDTALLAESTGGQISGTALVENWLGTPALSGRELAAAFRNHAERFDIAEELDVRVDQVRAERDILVALAADGRSFSGRGLIWCAGAAYRRLNVPGEDRFLGRGIAFCATCDAPLYQGKRVAVVGGGNSAFTAARDLLHWAREIHVINIEPDFQADPALVEEVGSAPNVKFHKSSRVLEYLGSGALSGVRLETGKGDSEKTLDLPVDGVFLEIGLSPNTRPVAGLVDLNAQGEIPVNRDQSTAVPGFFAAGDATDEPHKQIIVAAAAGAKAALSAYEFLRKRK
ncbi:MAG: FAD-dependent oxidoreductase [Proteobacteria bacterium]|nr:FAD-dependent oxidoreductase [Pseudomonadota bacterium]